MTGYGDLGACYATLWAATGATAAIGALTSLKLVYVAAPHDALQASAATVLELVGHNALVALWPLALVAIGWPAIPIVRIVGDALVTGQLLAHGLLIGDAWAQHPHLWRYLPHLPFEWLALAAPSAGWLLARRGPAGAVRPCVPLAATSIAALVVAAVLETWAVPL